MWQDLFYSDPLVTGDFRQYVAALLNHVNIYTGLAYREDPTILAWESGAGLQYPPYNWTVELAEYVKGL